MIGLKFNCLQAKNRTEHMNLQMRRLTHDMALAHETLTTLKNSVTLNHNHTTKVVGSLQEDMAQYQRQTKEVLNACQQDMVKSSQTVLDTLNKSITSLKSEMEAMKTILQSTSGPSQTPK